MNKRGIFCLVSGFLALSTVMTACAGQAPVVTPTTETPTGAPPTTAAAVTTTPGGDKPQYGGVLNLCSGVNLLYFDSLYAIAGQSSGFTLEMTNQGLWGGDWAKGPAGGYGTKQTDWADDYDLFDLKTGYLAESWKWTANADNNTGTVVYQIRQGVHWALNPKFDTSRMVGGREVTADDVVYNLKRAITDPKSYNSGNPILRQAQIAKTGPWEVTVTVPLSGLWQAIARFGDAMYIQAPEVTQKYGNAQDWRNSVGTGPFMLDDYVDNSQATLVRNPNYWMKNPVGPGKGDQLPYLNGANMFIIQDPSTQLAALRTGKIDQLADNWNYTGVNWEDAASLEKTTPALLHAAHGVMSGLTGVAFNTKRKPFDDVRVRQALMMATDLNGILQSQFGGVGQTMTWPYPLVKGYENIYVPLDSPQMPASTKELYTYNPDKAKELLKEAGYANGFTFSLTLTQPDADYFSIMVDMFSKVGVTMKLDIEDPGTVNALQASRNYDATVGGQFPISIYYIASAYWGNTLTNYSQINDPYINQNMADLNVAEFTQSTAQADQIARNVYLYVLSQVYNIPRPRRNPSIFWWPWLKNYDGEFTLGYHDYRFWTAYAWLDQNLKKQMGH